MALGLLERFANRLGLKARMRALEDWWFDANRHIKTAGDVPMPDTSKVVGPIRDAHFYAPVRVANAYAALRELPIRDFSEYTFIDIGSGKGRMLFVAAEYPFRKVLGVEFSTELHAQAKKNIGRYRYSSQRCDDIESVCADAAEFEFPDKKLVLYLFNPFGPEIMGRMLANLQRSLEANPRPVTIVMLWPEHAELIAQMPGMIAYRQTRRHHIYRTGNAEERRA